MNLFPLVGLLLSLVHPNILLAQPEPHHVTREDASDHDHYGMWKRSPNFGAIRNLGVRVVDAPSFRSFFGYYLPSGFSQQSSKHAIVAVHGTGGTIYAELQDEAAMAQKLGYAVIAVQMSMPEEPQRNLPPRELYGLIHQAVKYVEDHENVSFASLAYVGFSVGGSKSFQIAYQDALSPQPLFSLIVNHSGLSKAETHFIDDIKSGHGPAKPFQNITFGFYCGLQDEEWGKQQCDDMSAWQQIVNELGAKDIQVIRDEQNGHMGYRKNTAYHEQFMRWFMGM